MGEHGRIIDYSEKLADLVSYVDQEIISEKDIPVIAFEEGIIRSGFNQHHNDDQLHKDQA